MSLLRNSIFSTIAFMAVALTLTSCNRQMIYSHYENIDDEGWNRNDTICFEIPNNRDGSYTEILGLRTRGDYPFSNLTLIICQHSNTQESINADTVNIETMSETGIPKGSGTNYRQIDIPLPTTVNLKAGDTLRVSIRHYMEREILPGITDVGVSLKIED